MFVSGHIKVVRSLLTKSNLIYFEKALPLVSYVATLWVLNSRHSTDSSILVYAYLMQVFVFGVAIFSLEPLIFSYHSDLKKFRDQTFVTLVFASAIVFCICLAGVVLFQRKYNGSGQTWPFYIFVSTFVLSPSILYEILQRAGRTVIGYAIYKVPIQILGLVLRLFALFVYDQGAESIILIWAIENLAIFVIYSVLLSKSGFIHFAKTCCSRNSFLTIKKSTVLTFVAGLNIVYGQISYLLIIQNLESNELAIYSLMMNVMQVSVFAVSVFAQNNLLNLMISEDKLSAFKNLCRRISRPIAFYSLFAGCILVLAQFYNYGFTLSVSIELALLVILLNQISIAGTLRAKYIDSLGMFNLHILSSILGLVCVLVLVSLITTYSLTVVLSTVLCAQFVTIILMTLVVKSLRDSFLSLVRFSLFIS